MYSYPVRIAKKVTETVTHVKDHQTICDLCKEPIEHHGAFNRTDVKVEASIGDYFPETDAREHYRADICPDCFVEKVMPALKEIGVEFHESIGESDYYDKTIDTTQTALERVAQTSEDIG